MAAKGRSQFKIRRHHEGLLPMHYWYFKNICDKHEIDEQEIDKSLTFNEVKKHFVDDLHVKLESDEAMIQMNYQKYLIETEKAESFESARSPIEYLIDIYKKWLYIEEDYTIEGPMCVAVANFDKGDPDIWGIIGPSGSLKTEVIRALGTKENDHVYPISSLTEHTFISGFDKSPEADIIPMLKGKLILIKDLTTILAKDEKIRSQIFADFRDIIDGYMDKKFGNKIHKTYNNIHDSILFASTNAIEGYYSMYSCLGQRILFFRPRSDEDKSVAQAEKVAEQVTEMRKEIAEATDTFMKSVANWDKLPAMSTEQRVYMRPYYKFLAHVRTSIKHDYQGNINDIPEPELPTRIAKSINRMCQVHAMLYGRKEVEKEDLEFGLRIVYDNVPLKRITVLKHLVGDKPKLTVTALSEVTNLGVATIRKIMADLVALGIVSGEAVGKEGTKMFTVCSEYSELVGSSLFSVGSGVNLYSNSY